VIKEKKKEWADRGRGVGRKGKRTVPVLPDRGRVTIMLVRQRGLPEDRDDVEGKGNAGFFWAGKKVIAAAIAEGEEGSGRKRVEKKTLPHGCHLNGEKKRSASSSCCDVGKRGDGARFNFMPHGGEKNKKKENKSNVSEEEKRGVMSPVRERRKSDGAAGRENAVRRHSAEEETL